MAKDLRSEFAEYLDLLLTFHMDDDEEGQGQFGVPVAKVETPTGSPHVRIVSLDDGREVRVTVEAM